MPRNRSAAPRSDTSSPAIFTLATASTVTATPSFVYARWMRSGIEMMFSERYATCSSTGTRSAAPPRMTRNPTVVLLPLSSTSVCLRPKKMATVDGGTLM